MTKDTPKKTREFGVILESIDSTVKQVLELAHTHTEQLKRLEDVPDTLGEMKDDIEAIKVSIGAVEGEKPLKQRVEDLEAKVSTS